MPSRSTTLINWPPESVSQPRHRVRNNSGIVLPAYDKMIDTVYRVVRGSASPSPPRVQFRVTSHTTLSKVSSCRPRARMYIRTWNKRPGDTVPKSERHTHTHTHTHTQTSHLCDPITLNYNSMTHCVGIYKGTVAFYRDLTRITISDIKSEWI